MKTALMLRVGGLGDLLLLTPVAKELSKTYKVDMAIGSPTGAVHKLLEGLAFVNQLYPVTRLNGIDCFEDKQKHYISVEILKDNYDEVFDFKFSVEENRAGLNKSEGWRSHLNSNFINWYDLTFSWANIDWKRLPDSAKRPIVAVNKKADEWAIEHIGQRTTRAHKVIGIQLQASSLMRTFYRANDLPEIIHKTYPDDVVLVYRNDRWELITKTGRDTLLFPDDLDPIVASTALIRQMNAFICADSGVSHVAEAVETPHVTMYTTVPGWTRSNYYATELAVEPSVECHPCFTLDLFCPLEKERAKNALSDREKNIIDHATKGDNIHAVAKKYSTVPRGIETELQGALKRVEGLSAVEPACVKSITPEKIIDALKKALDPAWGFHWQEENK